MKALTIAAALCALLAQPGAHAATFVANLAGTGIHQTSTDDPITWTGQVTVVTDGSANGIYAGDTLESITVDTDVFDWSFTKGQTQIVWEALPGLFLLVGPEAGASVTLADGRLTGISLIYDDYFNVDVMSGLQVQAQSLCRTGDCHGVPNNYLVSGTLAPLASPVPEPPDWIMLLTSLGAALALARPRHD